jgi:hypothetical protein
VLDSSFMAEDIDVVFCTVVTLTMPAGRPAE